MAKKITTIPATLNRFTSKPVDSFKRRKVAGYARVSTEHDEQQSSYEAQMDYYTKYISSRPDWEFVGMYSDEEISATSTKHREGFKRMVEDALAGKIDLIIAKSVSRFARNTVDSLTTIRTLKDKGIECYFEKENIWTFDAKGELLITIMSSLAQDESRNISENTTWGKRKAFADGHVTLGYGRFLGYDKGPDGNLVINHEQAKIVREIYRMFLDGYSLGSICKELTQRGIKTPGGKDQWKLPTVRSILRNEKYKGDALLQKTFTVNFMEHKLVKNNGEVPQYYIENNHEAIIPKDVFDLVQEELKRRLGSHVNNGKAVMTAKIQCGCCGKWYGVKTWHSTCAYRKRVYQCNNKFKAEEKCTSPNLSIEEIHGYFIKGVNSILSNKQELIENMKVLVGMLQNTGADEARANELKGMIEELAVKLDAMGGNRFVSVALTKEYQDLLAYTEEHDELQQSIVDRRTRAAKIELFMKNLEAQEGLIQEYDENLWNRLVEKMVVKTKDDVSIVFRDGSVVKC